MIMGSSMGKKTILRLIIVSICSLAVILAARELGEKNFSKVWVLTDYPNSTWYSEQTGDMIEVGEDFEYEDEIPGISITKEYRGDIITFFLFHNGSEYWIRLDGDERGTELEEVWFTGEITEEDSDTYITFTPMEQDRDSIESRKQMIEMFGSQEKIIFKKVPNQHFDQYPNSIWKSEEMKCTLVVPSEKELEEDGKAELWVELEGVKERYGFCEPQYNAQAWGEICYNPELEQEDILNFNDYIYCSILILEENNYLYMTLSEFDVEKDCPEKIKKYFMENLKITLQKVK